MSSFKFKNFSAILGLIIALLFLSACGGSGSQKSTTGASNNSTTSDVTPSARSLEEIIISPLSHSFPEGSQVKFASIGIYNDNTNEDLSNKVTWSVNDINSASVDNNGYITLTKAGLVTVSASFEGTNAGKQITITPATLNSIEITPQHLDIATGLQHSFQAKGRYSDGSIHDITSQIIWQSNDTSIVDFVAEIVTAKSGGTTEITATFGDQTAQANITVNAALLQRIEIATVNKNLEIGFQSSLEALAYYSDGRIHDVTAQVTWSLDNSNIASINAANDTISGLAIGTARLLADFSGFSHQQTILVNDATLSRIEISPKNASIVAGYKKTFVATGIFSNQTSRDITELVTWTTSDDSIAEIDNRLTSSGNSLGVSKGTVTISASYLESTSNIQVEVTDAVLTSIEVSPTNVSLAQGLSQRYTANAFYSDGSQSEVTDQVDWFSDNTNLTAIAGNTEGLFKANTIGSALVIASLNQIQGFTQTEITNATFTSLSIVRENSSQAVGTSQNLTAFGQYSDGSNVDLSNQVAWASSDPVNATISNSTGSNGRLTGVNFGNVIITASIDGQSSSVSIEITAAELLSIELSSLAGPLYINQLQQVWAMGVYSDSNRQDLSSQVHWSSANSTIAFISNIDNNAGLVSALSAGSSLITATFSGITSPSFSVDVVDNPDIPGSIGLQTTPNVILNNGIDSTIIHMTVKPLQSHGVIADGTNINFIVLENSITRVVTATTIDGEASLNLTSTTNGFIVITAEVNNTEINARTVVFSTDNFVRVLQVAPVSSVVFNADKTEFKQGSLIALFIRNVSNRDFNLLAFQMINGIDALPGLPVTDLNLLSDGVLEGGEYTGLVYSLDNDTINNTIRAGYLLSDDVTLSQFGFNVTYQY